MNRMESIRAVAAGSLILLFSPGLLGAEQQRAAAVLACASSNLPPAAKLRDFEIASTDASGNTRTLQGALYVAPLDDGYALTLQVERPADMAGAAFLLRQGADSEQMFVYLPAVRRMRRITGQAANTSMFGSALRYSDIKALQGGIASASSEWLGETEQGGRAGDRIALAWNSEDGTAESAVLEVDRETCLIRGAQVSSNGKLVREFQTQPEHYVHADPHWYFSRAEMRDPETGLVTVLSIREAKGYEDIPSRLFSPNQFHRARFDE